MTQVPRDALPLAAVISRWDALASEWAISDEERSSLLGALGAGPVDRVSTYDPSVAETRMRLLVALVPVLEAVHPDREYTRRWLRRPNAALGGGTPLANMASSPEWIRWLIDAVGIAS